MLITALDRFRPVCPVGYNGKAVIGLAHDLIRISPAARIQADSLALEMSPIQEPDSQRLEWLMQRYQQSDRAAGTLLAEKLSPKLYQFCVTQTGNRDQAKDLLQECWLRIHKARHTYRPGQPVLPWVYAIANHVRVDHYRKAQRIARIEVSPDDSNSIEAASYDPPKPGTPELWKFVRTLPEQQRQTVLLLKVAGLSLEEVSWATGVSVGAVKQRAHRAYTTLRHLLGGQR